MNTALLLFVLILLGLVPATIAWNKGYPFLLWWLYGAVLIVIALPHAILAEGAAGGFSDAATDIRHCPSCHGKLAPDAIECRRCGYELKSGAGIQFGGWNAAAGDRSESGASPEWDDGFARVSRMGPGAPGRGHSTMTRGDRKPVVAAVAALAVGGVVLAAFLTLDDSESVSSLFSAADDKQSTDRLTRNHRPDWLAPSTPSSPASVPAPPVSKQPGLSPSRTEHVLAPSPPRERDSAGAAVQKVIPDTPVAETMTPPVNKRHSSESDAQQAEAVAPAAGEDPPPVPGPPDHASGAAPARPVEPWLLGADKGAAEEDPEEQITQKSRPDPDPVPDRNAVASRGLPDKSAKTDEEPPAHAVTPPTKPVETGDDVQAVGEVVAWIQGGLREFGFYDGPIDGRAGLRTQEAIRAYQRSRNLTPHGRINHALLVSLRRSLEEVRRPNEERVRRRAERTR